LLITLFNDMADRLHTTSQELENRRHYMEVILESIPTGVISIDGEGHIHTLNRAARTMFSVERAETLSDIFKGPDLREIIALIADAERRPFRGKSDLSLRDGPGTALSLPAACRQAAPF
jgi:nitrogen fixation/metabolism regulation signal transduction histidine kinase